MTYCSETRWFCLLHRVSARHHPNQSCQIPAPQALPVPVSDWHPLLSANFLWMSHISSIWSHRHNAVFLSAPQKIMVCQLHGVLKGSRISAVCIPLSMLSAKLWWMWIWLPESSYLNKCYVPSVQGYMREFFLSPLPPHIKPVCFPAMPGAFQEKVLSVLPSDSFHVSVKSHQIN